MIIHERRVSHHELGREALALECASCGASTVLIPGAPARHTSVDHRCGTAMVGPVWTVIERPLRAQRPIRGVA